MTEIFEPKFVKQKPIISWWRSGDPCLKLEILKPKLTDINIINTKRLSNEFIELCLKMKHHIFLHVNITGTGNTIFEPKIPTVKETFLQLKKLIDSGFNQKQILICVDPVLPNDNGLNALKLLLKLFTEYKILRLRFIRFSVLRYMEIDQNIASKNSQKTFTITNYNIIKRDSTKRVGNYLIKNATFFKDYYKLIDDYKAIISVDNSEEALIGIRELLPFGYKNEWINENGEREKLINYENGNKFKPILNIISGSNPVRCSNRCLLCPWKY